jgi:hypothetical protein
MHCCPIGNVGTKGGDAVHCSIARASSNHSKEGGETNGAALAVVGVKKFSGLPTCGPDKIAPLADLIVREVLS